MSDKIKNPEFVIPFDPANDGKDHINIYSMGATILGRRLTNFSYIPFDHPYYGHFCSMEGFWYYLRNGCVDERLRATSGMSAKTLGRQGDKKQMPHFRDDIIGAIYQKIIQNETIHKEFIESTLPFAHYYVFDNKVKQAVGSDWLVDGFENLRVEMRQGNVPRVWLRCAKRYEEQAALDRRVAEQLISDTTLDVDLTVSLSDKNKQSPLLVTKA